MIESKIEKWILIEYLHSIYNLQADPEVIVPVKQFTLSFLAVTDWSEANK